MIAMERKQIDSIRKRDLMIEMDWSNDIHSFDVEKHLTDPDLDFCLK